MVNSVPFQMYFKLDVLGIARLPGYVPKRPTDVQIRYGAPCPYDLARINQFTGMPLELGVPSFVGQAD